MHLCAVNIGTMSSFQAVVRIRDILVRIRTFDKRIRLRIRLFPSGTVKTPTKNIFFLSFYAQSFFTSFFKDKKSLKSHKNSKVPGFSKYFCLLMEVSRRPKNIRDPTDLEHCVQEESSQGIRNYLLRIRIRAF